MKIASFNINNINRRLTNSLAWLRLAEPDVVCFQELKAADSEFPAKAIWLAGYHAVLPGREASKRSSDSGAMGPRGHVWSCQATTTICLVPVFGGAFLSSDSKDALLARFYTGAPQRQRRSVERYSIVKRA
jgi:hypothetical protein